MRAEDELLERGSAGNIHEQINLVNLKLVALRWDARMPTPWITASCLCEHEVLRYGLSRQVLQQSLWIGVNPTHRRTPANVIPQLIAIFQKPSLGCVSISH